MRRLVGDLRQLACVRRIVLDDGPERGVRALSFSTGGGLDFWVLCDRSFDIGPLWWRGTSVAWQGPNGFASPALHDAEGDGGFGFERSFGGFLVTCGLDHIRQPQISKGLPLHGRLPFSPGRLLSYGEDWNAPVPMLFCEGEVIQARLNGERLRLVRRIEAPIGGAGLRIIDKVCNVGARDEAVAVLYHMNFGFPLVGAGTRVELNGSSAMEPIGTNAGGLGPRVECFPAGEDAVAACTVSRASDGKWRGLQAKVSWETSALPYAQIWNDLRPYTNVVAIEPVTSERMADGSSGPGPILLPGETLRSGVAVEFCDA